MSFGNRHSPQLHPKEHLFLLLHLLEDILLLKKVASFYHSSKFRQMGNKIIALRQFLKVELCSFLYTQHLCHNLIFP